jgi:capsular polysaccharide transport system permease protein
MQPDVTIRQKRPSLSIQISAVHALFMREILTRFGHYRLGYLWAIIEPAIHVCFMLLLLGGLSKHTIPGIDYSVFLIAGILPWFMFSNSVNRALGAVEGNKGLFHYRVIRPVDTIISRVALEAVIYIFCFMFFLMGLFFFGIDLSVSHIPLLFLCWFGMIALSFSVSLIMMVIGSYSQEIEKIVNAVMRILYFASGIVFSVHMVPVKYQGYILWNPVVHGIETMRYALSPSYPIHHVSLVYFFGSIIILLLLGLLMYRAREKAMLTTS